MGKMPALQAQRSEWIPVVHVVKPNTGGMGTEECRDRQIPWTYWLASPANQMSSGVIETI